MSYFASKTLLVAKALGAKDWSHPKIIRAARHMAHDGKTIAEINEAVGWNVAGYTARARLKKFNIIPHNKTNRSHRGFDTVLSNHATVVDTTNFKPRTKAGAECF